MTPCLSCPIESTRGLWHSHMHDDCMAPKSHFVYPSSSQVSYLRWADSPAIIYPTFQRIFLTMTMEQRDIYLTQFKLPPHRSPSPVPVPAPTSPTPFLLTQLSSPTPSDVSSFLIAIDLEYGLDEDAVTRNQSFIMRIGNNSPIISAPTCLLNIPVTRCPASLLTECFQCLGRGHYQEDCPQYVCPHCHLSAPGHPQSSCLSLGT